MPPTPSQAPKPTRPIQRFADAVAKCRAEASTYGRCITADYNNVYKDKCAREFETLRACWVRAAGRKG